MTAGAFHRDEPTSGSPAAAADPPAASKRDYRPLWLALSIAFAANIMAGILLGVDMATDGDEELLQALTALDLLSIAIAMLFTFGKLRGAAKRDSGAADLDSLSRAKLSAESANRAKSRYLATVSHEIRSPLNAIYGYAQLMDVDDGADPRDAAKVIRRCAEHLSNLVEGLLDISQLEFGVLRVRTEEVRFGPFLEQLVAMMQPAATAKGLTFRYEPAERMPDYVRLDPSRLRQILINLLSNAIKFTDAGSVTLKIGYSSQIATFEIRDTGPGIAPDDRARIFEPFEQVGDGHAGHAKPGAGLGLAISRAITEILGGKIELESELGAGSCFRVTMMLSEVAGKMPLQIATRRVSGYEGRPRTILLVDDDADQRLFLARLLRSIGFEVLDHGSGEAALDDSYDEHIDLAILDISLPGMSGWETATALRRQAEDGLQILMLSANSEELHRPESKTPAHDLFIVKPVEFEALIEAIGGLLHVTWRWEATEALAEPAPTAFHPPQLEIKPISESAQAHVGRLKEFLRIGYVRGIEAEIQELETAAPEAAPLVGRLYDCLDRYDLAGMAKLLQER